MAGIPSVKLALLQIVPHLALVNLLESCGEENYTMGNDHQYMLGQYNGLQNNLSWRFNYATEQGFQGGASMEPKGKAGASSGTCAWRS